MFRWINKQPGLQFFLIDAVTVKASITEYYYLINRQASAMVYSNTQSMGGHEYGKPSHLRIFTFLEAINDAFEVYIFFQGFTFIPY